MAEKKTVEELSQTDILEVAQALGMDLKRSGQHYTWTEHDSLVITPRKNMFSWFSRDVAGGVFDLVRTVKEEQSGQAVSFKEAKHFLETGEFKTFEASTEPLRPFTYYLQRYENAGFQQANDYLMKERGLSQDTIDFFRSKGVLVQANHKTGNVIEPVVVFKTVDPSGKVTGASLQGIKENKRLHDRGRLKQLMRASDGLSGMHVDIGQPKRLIVAEAPIDLMSYYELHKDDLQDVRLLAMDGLKEGAISRHFMELRGLNQGHEVTIDRETAPKFLETVAKTTKFFDNPEHHQDITLAIDNDDAAHRFVSKLQNKGIAVQVDIPKISVVRQDKNDWNDFLKKESGTPLDAPGTHFYYLDQTGKEVVNRYGGYYSQDVAEAHLHVAQLHQVPAIISSKVLQASDLPQAKPEAWKTFITDHPELAPVKEESYLLRRARQKLARLEREFEEAVSDVFTHTRIRNGQPLMPWRQQEKTWMREDDRLHNKARRLQDELKTQQARVESLEQKEVSKATGLNRQGRGLAMTVENIPNIKAELAKADRGESFYSVATIRKYRKELARLEALQEQLDAVTIQPGTQALIDQGLVNQWQKQPNLYFVKGLRRVALELTKDGIFRLGKSYLPQTEKEKTTVEDLLQRQVQAQKQSSEVAQGIEKGESMSDKTTNKEEVTRQVDEQGVLFNNLKEVMPEANHASNPQLKVVFEFSENSRIGERYSEGDVVDYKEFVDVLRQENVTQSVLTDYGYDKTFFDLQNETGQTLVKGIRYDVGTEPEPLYEQLIGRLPETYLRLAVEAENPKALEESMTTEVTPDLFTQVLDTAYNVGNPAELGVAVPEASKPAWALYHQLSETHERDFSAIVTAADQLGLVQKDSNFYQEWYEDQVAHQFSPEQLEHITEFFKTRMSDVTTEYVYLNNGQEDVGYYLDGYLFAHHYAELVYLSPEQQVEALMSRLTSESIDQQILQERFGYDPTVPLDTYRLSEKNVDRIAEREEKEFLESIDHTNFLKVVHLVDQYGLNEVMFWEQHLPEYLQKEFNTVNTSPLVAFIERYLDPKHDIDYGFEEELFNRIHQEGTLKPKIAEKLPELANQLEAMNQAQEKALETSQEPVTISEIVTQYRLENGSERVEFSSPEELFSYVQTHLSLAQRRELEALMSQPGRGDNLDMLMAIDAAYTDYDVYLNDDPILEFFPNRINEEATEIQREVVRTEEELLGQELPQKQSIDEVRRTTEQIELYEVTSEGDYVDVVGVLDPSVYSTADDVIRYVKENYPDKIITVNHSAQESLHFISRYGDITMTDASAQLNKKALEPSQELSAESNFGDLPDVQEAAPLPEANVSQPLEGLSPDQPPSQPLLHFSTKADPKSSPHKKNYHAVTAKELRKLNRYAPTIQDSAKWYLDNLADSQVTYFYQDGNEVKSISIDYLKENFMHLTGLAPTGPGQTPEKTLVDLAQGKGDFDYLLIANKGATFDKLKVLPELQAITEAESFFFGDLSSVERLHSLELDKAIRSSDKDLLLAVRSVDDGEGPKHFPASLLRLKDQLNIALDASQSEKTILGVFRTRNGQVDTLSINQDYIKDKGQAMKAMVENGRLEPVEVGIKALKAKVVSIERPQEITYQAGEVVPYEAFATEFHRLNNELYPEHQAILEATGRISPHLPYQTVVIDLLDGEGKVVQSDIHLTIGQEKDGIASHLGATIDPELKAAIEEMDLALTPVDQKAPKKASVFDNLRDRTSQLFQTLRQSVQERGAEASHDQTNPLADVPMEAGSFEALTHPIFPQDDALYTWYRRLQPTTQELEGLIKQFEGQTDLPIDILVLDTAIREMRNKEVQQSVSPEVTTDKTKAPEEVVSEEKEATVTTVTEAVTATEAKQAETSQQGEPTPEKERRTVAQIIADRDTKALSQHMKEGVKDYFSSERYKTYLDTLAKLPHYSDNNLRLLMRQRNNLTAVASANSWRKDFGRLINKGEKALWIWAPKQVLRRDKETGEPVLNEEGKQVYDTRFNLVPVFDVSQTNGKDLGLGIKILEGDHKGYATLYQATKSVAEEQGIQVEISRQLPPDAEGEYRRDEAKIVLKAGRSEQATLHAFFHELAHVQLGHGGQDQELSLSTKELQAESLAYVLSSHFGIDTSETTFDYLASWSQDKEGLKDLEAQLKIVQKEASELIQKLDQSFEKYQAKDLSKTNAFTEKLERFKEASQEKIKEKNEVQKDPKKDLGSHQLSPNLP